MWLRTVGFNLDLLAKEHQSINQLPTLSAIVSVSINYSLTYNSQYKLDTTVYPLGKVEIPSGKLLSRAFEQHNAPFDFYIKLQTKICALTLQSL